MSEITARIVAWEGGQRKNRRRAAGLAKLRQGVGAILGAVLQAWCRRDKPPVPVWRSRQAVKFTDKAVGRRVFVTIMDFLKAGGLIHHKAGGHPPLSAQFRMGQAPDKGKASRYWPTVALLQAAAAHGLTPKTIPTAFRYVAPPHPPRILPPVDLRPWSRQDWASAGSGRSVGRMSKGPFVVLTDPEGAAIAADVAAQNCLAAAVGVSGCLPPRWHRIFLGCWRLHGRWYATGTEPYWQLDRNLRAQIRIGGEAVVELDVRASHLTLLHGLLGMALPASDLYAVPGVPREVAKRWVVETLGKGRPPQRWSRRLEGHSPARLLSVATVRTAVLQRYPFLAEPAQVVPPDLVRQAGEEARFLVSPYLMAVEAAAMTRAIGALREQQVLALPVHDSLIVPARTEPLARQAVEAAYAAVCGDKPRLTVAAGAGGRPPASP